MKKKYFRKDEKLFTVLFFILGISLESASEFAPGESISKDWTHLFNFFYYQRTIWLFSVKMVLLLPLVLSVKNGVTVFQNHTLLGTS